MSCVSTASISSDSAEPTSDAGAGAVSVACCEAFVTTSSFECSGESDGADSGGGAANCAVGAVGGAAGAPNGVAGAPNGAAGTPNGAARVGGGACVAVFPGSDSESSEEQEGWQEYAEELAMEVALAEEEMVPLAFN